MLVLFCKLLQIARYIYSIYVCFMVSENLAGMLIDIIKTRGQAGFIAFLEVVEYEYGDVFLEITDKAARMPPRG